MSLLVNFPDGRQLLGYGQDAAPADGRVKIYAPGRDPEWVSTEGLTIEVLPLGSGCFSCAAIFRQRGERTSHCTSCHETFEGLTLFDAHFVDTANGRSCKKAATMKWRGVKLRLVEGTWRGPAMDKSRFGAGAAS